MISPIGIASLQTAFGRKVISVFNMEGIFFILVNIKYIMRSISRLYGIFDARQFIHNLTHGHRLVSVENLSWQGVNPGPLWQHHVSDHK